MNCNDPAPTPPAANPTFIGLDPQSSLCTTGHPANVLTGILLNLLREHFANADNLEYNGQNEFTTAEGTKPLNQLQSKLWTPNNTTTGIQIQSVWDYNSQDIQRRPALYVKRNALQTQRLGINDGFTVNSKRDPKTGKVLAVQGEYKSLMILGSHTVFCVGSTGAEAELYGMEVFSHLVGFAQLIREEMNFNRFMVMECGEVAILDEFEEHFVVPIVVAYAFGWSWRINKVAPWLKTLAIALTS